jgi:glycosyltransferase involved in cell wall biosynthesis
MRLVMNGYDERDFAGVDARAPGPPLKARPLELLHSGVLYPDMRNPTTLFQALAELKREQVITTESLRVRLRASGYEEDYRKAIMACDIADIVSIEPGVPYRDALSEMSEVDGLLLFQGEEANQQVPAKLFEYLRAGTPILGLLHPEGDTARLLREAGVGRVTCIDDASDIKAALRDFIINSEERDRWSTPLCVAQTYSREASARALSAVLHDVIDPGR